MATYSQEVFRNEILLAWQKSLNVEVILISEFMNSEVNITSNNFAELILISEITNLG